MLAGFSTALTLRELFEGLGVRAGLHRLVQAARGPLQLRRLRRGLRKGI